MVLDPGELLCKVVGVFFEVVHFLGEICDLLVFEIGDVGDSKFLNLWVKLVFDNFFFSNPRFHLFLHLCIHFPNSLSLKMSHFILFVFLRRYLLELD